MSERMRNILSVDFDFWFDVDAYHEGDWGHREALFFLGPIWGIRASSAVAAGEDPRKKWKIAEDEVKPWHFGKFMKERGCVMPRRCCIDISESHSVGFTSFKSLKGPLHLVHVDAHHDFGYSMEELNCDNWIYHLAKHKGNIAKITMIYPKWRQKEEAHDEWEHSGKEAAKKIQNLGIEIDVGYGLEEKFPSDMKFTKGIICHSGAWVPPWLDGAFQNLVGDMSIHSPQGYRWYGHTDYDEATNRHMDWDEVEKHAEAIREFHEEEQGV